MKASQSFGHLATVLLSAASLASAWPGWLPDLDALVVRQDTTSDAPSPTRTFAPTLSDSSESPVDTATTHNLNTGASSATGTGGGSSGKNATTTKGPKHTLFDQQSPAGSVVMITPAVTEGSQLYKIGDYVTWAWNYTNLLGTPTAVDVLASCSVASRTYTLTQNMTFATQGSYTWDTNGYQESNKATPLLTEQYTLVIYDAESSVSATAEPGYLGTFTGFVFGLYATRSYTPLADGWQCASCNAALSDMDKRALGFALTMSVITVLSFTWFVTGLGVAL